MSRREHLFRRACAGEGCKEIETVTFSTLRDYDEHARYRHEQPFRCSRHDRPDEVISVAQRIREVTYTVVEARGRKEFDGGRRSRIHLGGAWDDFQAYAEDFPVGTVLRVTAALILLPVGSSETDGAGNG